MDSETINNVDMNKFFISVTLLLFLLCNSNAQDPVGSSIPSTNQKGDIKSEPSNQPSKEISETKNNPNNSLKKDAITSEKGAAKDKLGTKAETGKLKKNIKPSSSVKQENNNWNDIKKLKEDNGYLQFLVDKEITLKGNKVKLFNGEILPIKKEDSQSLFALFGQETIDVIAEFKTDEVKFISQVIKDYTGAKDDFIKKGNTFVYIDVNSVTDVSDPIRFVTEAQNIVPFISKKEGKENLSVSGNTFRLIIPNSPTIFYSFNDLLDFVPLLADRDNDGVANDEDACPDQAGWANSDPLKNGCPPGFFAKLFRHWYYGLIALVLIAISIIIVWYLRPPKYHTDGGSSYVTYEGGELSEFASQLEISIDELIKLNPSCIPSEYLSMSKNQRKATRKTLKGRSLCIKSIDKTKLLSDRTIYNDDSKVQQLNNSIKTMQGDISDLRGELAGVQKEKIKLEQTLNQVNSDKQLVISNLNTERERTEKLASDIKIINDKVLFLDYLNDFCEKGSSFFSLSEKVSNQAYDYCNQLINQNSQQNIPVTLLLMKYQLSINSVPVGKWKQIIHDIKDTGAATNKQLIRSLSQPKTDIDKQAEFHKLLNEEVLLKYSSSILMFTEELRNLSRFQVDSHLVDEVQDRFAKHIEELLIAMKSVGLKAKYVPLFKNYTENLGLTKSVDQKLSIAYQNVKGLEKDSVAEVISYGFITNFGDSDTLIILA